MSYEKDELEVLTEKSLPDIIRTAQCMGLDEDVSEFMDNYRAYPGLPVIRLPHSCDEWIIGGVKEAQQLIADLSSAIEKIKMEKLQAG